MGDEVGLDLRNAARRAAREEGKSLGEWLKALMDDRAEALGVSPDDLGAEDRLQALTHGLVEKSGQLSARETEAPGAHDEGAGTPRESGSAPSVADDHASDGVRSRFDWDVGLSMPSDGRSRRAPEADLREGAAKRPAEPASRAAVDDWTDATWGTTTARAETPPRSTVEAKLNSLFSALNKSSGRNGLQRRDPLADDPLAEEAVVAPVVAAPRAPAGRASSDLLGRTALGSTRTLDQAIAEIAERQALLNRAPPPRTTRAPSDKGQPAPAAPTVLTTPTPVSDGSPALFASLKGDIARMSERLEAMHSDVAQRSAPAQGKDAAFHEIRSLLDRMRPDQSIDALERRVGDLTSKIDKALESHVAPDAFEHLSQRLEHVHASLSDRLSSKSGFDVDPESLEQAVRDIVGTVGSAQDRLPEAKALEALMQKLADKLDEAREPNVDAARFAELQGQVGRLAERIDRSDAGLTAIVSVERSLGELFSQMEETRDAAINAAENAARTAARDTLRSAMAESVLPSGQGQRQADAAVEQVAQDIAELKTARDAADKRLHAILNALNATLEKVIDRLGALEDDAAEPATPPEAARSPLAGSPEAPPRAAASANPLNAAFRARPLPMAEPSVSIGAPRRSGERPAPRLDGGDADFLIEPGVGQASGRQPGPAASRASGQPQAAPAVQQPDPANFIAAARRAAQAAAQSAQEAAARPTGAAGKPAGGSTEPGRSLKERASTFLAARRRPLLLALAGIVIMMGAVQVARLTLQRSDATAVAEQPDAPSAATPSPAGPAKAVAASEPSTPTESVATATADTSPPVANAGPSGDTGAAKPPAAASPVRSLPTLAMGAAANLAGARPSTPSLSVGLRNMAEDGSAAAQYEVGLRLADGRGVARDVKAAAEWFEKAAKLGLAPAAYRLGSLYEKGLGVSRDPATAVLWYQKAAEAGNVRAMHNLAVMSAEGSNGKSDYVKAASWFTKAAQAGVRDSQFNLAILYARGLGIEQSLTQSYLWFGIAAAQGDSDAATKRDEVAQRLDAKTLADAKKNVAEFQPAPAIPAANEVSPPPGGWDAVAPRSAPATTSFLKSDLGTRLSSM